MARGLGRVQVEIVAQLQLAQRERWIKSRTPVQLACHVYECAPQEVKQNHLRAVNKALLGLQRYGIVRLEDSRSYAGDRQWTLAPDAQRHRKIKPPTSQVGLKIIK